MPAPVFIGDEVSATAYRLAGIDTRVPERTTVGREFGMALHAANLVVITAEFAAQLSEDVLHQAVRRAAPLVLIVPDAAGRVQPADLDRQVDRVLGIEQ
jgi:vacuolar-type H+-ATPase subunit F/Vma7